MITTLFSRIQIIVLLGVCFLLFQPYAHTKDTPLASKSASFLPPDDDDDDDDDDDIHPTKYFVHLEPGTAQTTIDSLLNALNSVEVWAKTEIGLRLWQVNSFPYVSSDGIISNIDAHVTRSKSKTEINDLSLSAGYQVNDPGNPATAACFDSLQLPSIQGNHSVKISILDTGIGYGADDWSMNGFSIPFTGYDYINNDSNPNDQHGHGSYIAGLIQQIASPLPLFNNITYDIRKTHDRFGHGYLSELIPAIVDAVDAGADIINMSFSYQDYRIDTLFRPMQLAVQYAEQQGVLIVASAGNAGIDNDTSLVVSFPASFPEDNILTVTTNTCTNSLSSFSSYGANSVDVSILGEKIPAHGTYGSALKTGTSYSTAIVAALAGLMGTYQSTFDPAATKCGIISASIPAPGVSPQIVADGILDFHTALFQTPTCAPAQPLAMDARGDQTLAAREALTAGFKVFPNPFSSSTAVSIYAEQNVPATLAVYDDLGRMVLTYQEQLSVGDNNLELSEVNGLISGTYYLRIILPNESKVVKLLKL